jgi:hypothetical protein
MYKTTGMMSTNMVSGRELHLPCALLFWAPPDKEKSMTDFIEGLME